MGTLEKIQAVQARLAASYALHFDQLLPEEDRAYRSLLNKLSTLSDFLKLAARFPAELPARGEGSLIEGERLAAAMVARMSEILSLDGKPR